MKKIIAIVILAVMLLLIGCTTPTPNDPDKDRYKQLSVNKTLYLTYRAIEEELGYTLIVDEPVITEVDNDGVKTEVYNFTLDTKYEVGVKYYIMTFEEYEQLQNYQNEFNVQVIYPNVHFDNRPVSIRYKSDGNFYYVLETNTSSTFSAKLDENGKHIPNYWKYEENSKSTVIADYNSLRIEGADGFEENGVTYFYAYGVNKFENTVEVRVDYLEFCKFCEYVRG